MNGPRRSLSIFIVGIAGFLAISVVSIITTSEGEGVGLLAKRTNFMSERWPSAASANRGRPHDRPEAAPLLWGADPEARAHAPNPKGEGASCMRNTSFRVRLHRIVDQPLYYSSHPLTHPFDSGFLEEPALLVGVGSARVTINTVS